MIDLIDPDEKSSSSSSDEQEKADKFDNAFSLNNNYNKRKSTLNVVFDDSNKNIFR